MRIEMRPFTAETGGPQGQFCYCVIGLPSNIDGGQMTLRSIDRSNLFPQLHVGFIVGCDAVVAFANAFREDFYLMLYPTNP